MSSRLAHRRPLEPSRMATPAPVLLTWLATRNDPYVRMSTRDPHETPDPQLAVA